MPGKLGERVHTPNTQSEHVRTPQRRTCVCQGVRAIRMCTHEVDTCTHITDARAYAAVTNMLKVSLFNKTG